MQTLVLDCLLGPPESSATPDIQVRFGPFDLRTFSAGDSARVNVEVTYIHSGGSCSTAVAGAGSLTVTQATGQAAPGPAYVTPAFSRQASFALDFDGTSVSWMPGVEDPTDCSQPQLGRLHVTGNLDQAASDYGERPVCE